MPSCVKSASRAINRPPDILPAGRNCEGFTRKEASIKKGLNLMKTALQRFVSMAVRMSTQSGAHRFPHILLFSFLAVCPTVARADCGATGDIPFTITLLHPVPSGTLGSGACFIVKGPFARTSPGGLLLRDLPVGQPCTFYAPDDNFLSPFGSWDFHIQHICVAFGT